MLGTKSLKGVCFNLQKPLTFVGRHIVSQLIIAALVFSTPVSAHPDPIVSQHLDNFEACFQYVLGGRDADFYTYKPSEFAEKLELSDVARRLEVIEQFKATVHGVDYFLGEPHEGIRWCNIYAGILPPQTSSSPAETRAFHRALQYWARLEGRHSRQVYLDDETPEEWPMFYTCVGEHSVSFQYDYDYRSADVPRSINVEIWARSEGKLVC